MTLEQLEALHDARKDPRDLPHETTTLEATAYGAETATLGLRITMAKAAQATLAELDVSEPHDVGWLDHLNSWRQVLCAELLEIKSPIRDPKVIGRSQKLTVSIR